MAARFAIRPQVRLLVGVSLCFLRCGFSEGGDGRHHCKDALVLSFPSARYSKDGRAAMS